MSPQNLWEDIKEGARGGFEVLKEEMGKLTQELEKQGKIIKRKMDLSAIQRRVHQSFSQLGSRLYELFEEGKEKTIVTDPEIVKIIADIKGYKVEVESIEEEIDRIRETGTEKTKSDEDPKAGAGSTGETSSHTSR
jgi:DNA-binding Lrp family transcriptional regulator